MIRKIEGYNAWVGPIGDLFQNIFLKSRGFAFFYSLPLFSCNEETMGWVERNICPNSTLALLVIGNNIRYKITLDFIEKVNKTWNKFYEENTRK